MFDKLEDLVKRLDEVMQELSEPDVVSDQNRFRNLMKEQNELAPIVEKYKEYKEAKQTIEDSVEMLEEEHDEEMRELLKDQKTFTATAGVDYEPVTEPGLQTLNGLQATAYCRIRYVGDDFERTKRQRDVLIAMMEKAKGASVGTLMSAMNAVLPHVVTSIDVEDIAAVLSKVGDYKVTVSDGFPFAGMRAGASLSVGACVVPMSLTDNVVKLHEILYAEENYEPSAELKSFSAQIEADTKDRLQN